MMALRTHFICERALFATFVHKATRSNGEDDWVPAKVLVSEMHNNRSTYMGLLTDTRC